MSLGMVDHRNNEIYDQIYQELEKIAVKDESLRNAFENWEEISMTEEQYIAYESRLKRIKDDEAAERRRELLVQEAEEEGREKGMQEGIQEGENTTKEFITRRLLSKGIDMDVIAEATELSIEEIMKIQQELQE